MVYTLLLQMYEQKRSDKENFFIKVKNKNRKEIGFKIVMSKAGSFSQIYSSPE